MKKSKLFQPSIAAVATIILSLTTHPARAAGGTWLGTSGNWSDTATWSGGTVADGAGFTANFTGVDITADQTITVDTARVIGNIVFTDAATASHNLTLSGTNPLVLDVITDTPVIDVTQAGRVLAIDGEIWGNDGLTKSGAGMLVLSAANTYTGTTTVSAGELAATTGATFTPFGTGTVAIEANVLTLSPSSTAANSTLANPLTGTGTLNINPAAGRAMVLSGSLSGFTGTVNIHPNTGVAKLSTAGLTLGAGAVVNVTSGATWFLNAGTHSGITANLHGAGNSELMGALRMDGGTLSNTSSVVLQADGSVGANSGTGTINAVIAESGGSFSLTKMGAGTISLGAANTYTGTTIIDRGTLVLANVSALDTTSGIKLAGGTTLRPSVRDAILSAPITLGDSGTTSRINASTAGTGGADVAEFTLNGAISGAGNLTFNGSANNNSYGTIILGAAGTYSGSTLLTCSATGATLFIKLGIANALPTTTQLTMDGGAGAGTGRTLQLDLNGNDQTLAGLSSVTRNLRNQRIVNTSATAATLTVDGSGESTFSGRLATGSANGNFGLTKSGSGTLTLSGNNPYTGATTINGGMLAGVTGGACGSSAVTVASTEAILGVSVTNNTLAWNCSDLTFAAAGILGFEFDPASPSDSVAPLTVTNAADFTATPVVVVRGAPLTTLPVGSYPLMSWGSVSGTVPTSVVLPPTMAGNLTVTDNTLYLNVTTASALPLYWATGNGVWDINTSPNWKTSTGVASIYQETPAGAASVVFDDIDSGPGPNLSVTLPADVAPANVTFDNSSKNFTLGGPGAITGTTGVNMTGAGTVTLATANTYTGFTTIDFGGILKLGAHDAIPHGSLPSAFNVTVDGTLDLNGFNNTINGLSGTGIVDNTAPGTSSTLSVGFNGQSTSLSGPIQNSGVGSALGLTKVSTGTLTLSGANTYSGGTIISGGVLNADDASALGTGSVTFDGGTRLVVGNGITVTNPITIGANVGVVGRGLIEPAAGTQATISGPITINNGATGGGHFATSGTGAILEVAGPITASVPPNVRVGTIIFSGGGTGYSELILNQGTAMVGANNGIATTATFTFLNAGAGTLDLNGFNQSVTGITKGTQTATIGNSSTTADSTLTTTGTSTFAGTIQDTLGSGAMKVNLTVNGGALTLGGANTYTGATTVSAGTLALGANDVLADTTAVSIGNATLDAATFTDTLGTLDTTGGATINLNTGAALAFAGSSAIDWTGGTLNLSGTFVSGASLRFGTDNTGLTSTQLALISATGFDSFALNSNGYLTASSTGGYAAWAATNAPTGTPADDFDGDGVRNSVEYVLGGTKNTNDLGKLPKVSTTPGGDMVFTFIRDQASIDGSTTVVIGTSPDLTDWTTGFAVPDGAAAENPGVTVVKDSPAGFDTVTLTLPLAPNTKKFARLKVTVP